MHRSLLANKVPCGLLAGPNVLPHVRSGKLTALAVSGQSQSSGMRHLGSRSTEYGEKLKTSDLMKTHVYL